MQDQKHHFDAENDISEVQTGRDGPLLIAPLLDSVFYCEEAMHNPEIHNEEEAAHFCSTIGKTAAPRIAEVLDAVGPKYSPSGDYELGYTLNVPILRYFSKIDGKWILDFERMKANFATIAEVDRRVVVYLQASHFVYAAQELVEELMQDPRNLMWTRSGPVMPLDYHNVPMVGWSLADQSAPINVMRREAFNAAIDTLCALPPEARDRIAAIGILGETHDVIPSKSEGPDFAITADQLTDYSPAMKHGFRYWLEQKYATISAFNAILGSSFASFDAVEPPSKDIRVEPLDNFFEHIDSYAAGTVPVIGWVHDRLGRQLTLTVLLDGREIGEAELGYSRTDVSDAVPSIIDPNVGFRFNLDYRCVNFGIHTLEVQIRVAGGPPLQLSRSELVMPNHQQEIDRPVTVLNTNVTLMSTDPDLSGSLDGPRSLQTVFYNPLANSWLKYRNQVVRAYMEQFATIASKSSIPVSKVFSHQITPSLYGSWNADILAVDDSQQPSEAYNPGTTLYGGTATGSVFFALKKRLGWTRYAVNEMHPNMPLTDEAYTAMFEMHRDNGAVFVAPYYMNLKVRPFPYVDGLEKFLITPKNTRSGSDAYYRAICAVMTSDEKTRLKKRAFNESMYLAANLDVVTAISTGFFASGWEHFVAFGEKEGRLASVIPRE